MSTDNGQQPVSELTQATQASIAGELGVIRLLLETVLNAERTSVEELSVSDGVRQQSRLDDWPVAGAKRVLVPRVGNGYDAFPAPTGGALLFGANAARLGMSVVNAGTPAVILYLAVGKLPGVPAIWLGGSGGAWDGRLGNALWAGNVFAVGQSSTGTLVAGEV